jgi:poly(rC)-binding protein 2/3/4
VLVFSRSVEAGVEKGIKSGLNTGSSVTAQLVVSPNQVGCLLGKGGAIVSEMRKATGASIKIIGADQVSKCASDNEQVVQVCIWTQHFCVFLILQLSMLRNAFYFFNEFFVFVSSNSNQSSPH